MGWLQKSIGGVVLLSSASAQFTSSLGTTFGTNFGSSSSIGTASNTGSSFGTSFGTNFGSSNSFGSSSLSSSPIGGSSNSFTTPLSSSFFTPTFALSALPISFAFPTGFTQQSLFLPAPISTTPLKLSKAARAGQYVPSTQKIPQDPTASASLTNLVTNYGNLEVTGKGAEAIRAVFDQGSFRSYNMEMTVGNKDLMSADPTDELSVHCRLTTDYNTPQAKTWSDFAVGCGYKGSVGSLRICLNENKQDNRICRKLSFRVDARAFSTKHLNYTAPLINGMDTLLFNGMPVDLSMMSERTAFGLMNNLGMIAPMSTHAKLFLNGKYLGIFAFVQPVDQEFTKMHFKKDANNGKGSLYKDVWFNPLHLKGAIKDHNDPKRDDDDAFLEGILKAIEQTPLNVEAATAFFNQYFDINSLVDVTAFNTLIGATDDWRQRHNFFFYINRQKRTSKIYFIPWDYDRLYDEGSATRGALKGTPWWDLSTATNAACNQLILSNQEQAQRMGGSVAKIAWNKDILDQFPPDINVPVTCDRFTQLMALALGPKVRQRTREMANQITIPQIKAQWATWSAQISTALANDPAGPTYEVMLQHQQELEKHLTRSMEKALREANAKDASGGSAFATMPATRTVASSPVSTTSSLTSSTFRPAAPTPRPFSVAPFTPKSTSIGTSFAPPASLPASFAAPASLPASFSSSTFSTTTNWG